MELSNNYNEKISTWRNGISAIKDHDVGLNWIYKNHKRIYDYIKKKYTNKNTLKLHISVLAGVIKMLKGDKSKIYQKYSLEATNLMKDIQDSYLDNTHISKNRVDNFVTLQEIETQRDELGKLFNEDRSDNKLNLQYLLLCLYTYQPPIRQEYKDMLIVNKIPNDHDNFILNQNGKYYIIIQHDKVSKKYGAAKFLLSDTLNAIIKQSLISYPRQYILSLVNNPNKPIGKQMFENLLHSCFPDKKVSVDILRSAYITDKYNNKHFTMRDKEELAKLNRNSVFMASTVYHKIDNREKSIDDIIDEFISKIPVKKEYINEVKKEIKDIIDKYIV